MNEAILYAALAVLGWAALRLFRDVKGVSRKQNKVIAFLIRSEDLNPEKRREQLTAILEGK